MEVSVFIVVRVGTRDIEDCEWFEVTDEDKDEILEKINGQTATEDN